MDENEKKLIQAQHRLEETEKTKDSRLAREFVVALPVELGKDEWQSLVSGFIREQFVSDGMCADCAIHDTDGHNPHAHILLTVRPLDEQGKWQYKTEKEYLCVRDGEEKYTAELEKAFAEYNDLKSQSTALDPVELFYARENLRNECEEAAESSIHSASKGNDFWGMASARQTVDGELDLYAGEQRVNRILWERKQGEREQPQQKNPKDRGYER